MVRMAGSKLLARLLLLISSITLLSLLALTRCGIGGLVDNNILITDDGKSCMLTIQYFICISLLWSVIYFLCYEKKKLNR